MSFFATIFLILGASQLYWGWRGVRLARRKIASPALRGLVCAAILAVLVATLAYTVHEFGRRPEPVHMTLRDALLTAPFGWWIASSMLGFLLAIPFGMLAGVRAVARRVRGRAEIASPARRDSSRRPPAW